MELQHNNGAHTLNGTAKETTNKAAQNGTAKEIAANPQKGGTNGKADAEKPKLNPVKDENSDTAVLLLSEQQAPATEAVQTTEQAKPITAVLNLEGKLKVVADLHRRSVHRVNLISRMNQLEAFEVALTQENDELEDNPYQGCRLIIEDDKKRQFVTTTPGLIRLTSQFIFSACNEKLADIEKSIVFPNI